MKPNKIVGLFIIIAGIFVSLFAMFFTAMSADGGLTAFIITAVISITLVAAIEIIGWKMLLGRDENNTPPVHSNKFVVFTSIIALGLAILVAFFSSYLSEVAFGSPDLGLFTSTIIFIISAVVLYQQIKQSVKFLKVVIRILLLILFGFIFISLPNLLLSLI